MCYLNFFKNEVVVWQWSNSYSGWWSISFLPITVGGRGEDTDRPEISLGAVCSTTNASPTRLIHNGQTRTRGGEGKWYWWLVTRARVSPQGLGGGGHHSADGPQYTGAQKFFGPAYGLAVCRHLINVCHRTMLEWLPCIILFAGSI